MSLNPIASVTDYQSMLNRICLFTSVAALGAVWLLRTQLPALDSLLGQVDFSVETGLNNLLPIPGGSLLPALAVGLLARVYRIHSHIGHWLGIRERFEIDVILAEFVHRIGIEAENISEHDWLAHRHDLMRGTFYRFTSNQSPQIDVHLIHQALDLWSWFWIGVESTCVFIITSFLLIGANVSEIGLMTFSLTLLMAMIGLPAIRLQCKRAAIAQVRAILSNPARAAIVREAFSTLGDTGNHVDQAA